MSMRMCVRMSICTYAHAQVYTNAYALVYTHVRLWEARGTDVDDARQAALTDLDVARRDLRLLKDKAERSTVEATEAQQLCISLETQLNEHNQTILELREQSVELRKQLDSADIQAITIYARPI